MQYAYHIYIRVPRSEYGYNKEIPCTLVLALVILSDGITTYHMTSRTGISFLFYRLSIDKDTVTDLMLPRYPTNFLDNKKKIPYFTVATDIESDSTVT